MKKKISKRDFIKKSLAGLGATALGLKTSGLFAEEMKSISDNSGFPGPVAALWKWSKESPYYIVTPKGVKCQICPNHCILREGQESLCRTHIVVEDKLYTIAYGNPCSVHVDPIEKKPL